MHVVDFWSSPSTRRTDRVAEIHAVLPPSYHMISFRPASRPRRITLPNLGTGMTASLSIRDASVSGRCSRRKRRRPTVLLSALSPPSNGHRHFREPPNPSGPANSVGYSDTTATGRLLVYMPNDGKTAKPLSPHPAKVRGADLMVPVSGLG